MTRAQVLARLSRLRALTIENGATPAEADIAAAKARHLESVLLGPDHRTGVPLRPPLASAGRPVAPGAHRIVVRPKSAGGMYAVWRGARQH